MKKKSLFTEIQKEHRLTDQEIQDLADQICDEIKAGEHNLFFQYLDLADQVKARKMPAC